jgi:hypothetical protein
VVELPQEAKPTEQLLETLLRVPTPLRAVLLLQPLLVARETARPTRTTTKRLRTMLAKE